MVLQQLCTPIYSCRVQRERGGWRERKRGKAGESFHATPNHFHPCISQIVAYYSASTPIQTGTRKTRSILFLNWSFPEEALVCKTYFRDRAFLNNQGLKTEATSGQQAGQQALRQALIGSIPLVSGLIALWATRYISL